MRASVTLTLSVTCAATLLGAAVPRTLAGQHAPTSAAKTGATGPMADSVRAFIREMAVLLRERKSDEVVALYDTVGFMHVDDGVVTSWAEMAKSMRTFFATAKSNPVRIVGEPGVVIVDRNSAVVVVDHTTEPVPGQQAHDGIWTGVLRRGATGWKIAFSHSSDRPPATPPARE
jgi:hypothetical protein